jgi:general secretion pathway protein K
VRSGERGFALIAVLLVLGLLGIIGAEFAYSIRLEASAMRAWKDNVIAAHLAEAGLEQALRELSSDIGFATVADDGTLTFYDRNRLEIPRLPRVGVRLGPGAFTYRITDEQARINVNTAQLDRLDRLLQCLGVDKNSRDPITASILDWIDTNEEHRLSGAESDDYYLTLPTPYRARNGPIESIAELLQVKGVTPALFHGTPQQPGLAEFLTARGGTQVNVNTAGPVVFCAMGVSDAEISEYMQARREAPYTAVPGRLGGRGFAATSQTYRIEAEGIVGDRPRASLTAVVMRRGSGPRASTVILEWSGVR